MLIQRFSCFWTCLFSKIFETCLFSKRCLSSREYGKCLWKMHKIFSQAVKQIGGCRVIFHHGLYLYKRSMYLVDFRRKEKILFSKSSIIKIFLFNIALFILANIITPFKVFFIRQITPIKVENFLTWLKCMYHYLICTKNALNLTA